MWHSMDHNRIMAAGSHSRSLIMAPQSISTNECDLRSLEVNHEVISSQDISHTAQERVTYVSHCSLVGYFSFL